MKAPRSFWADQRKVGTFVALPLGLMSIAVNILNIAVWRAAPAYIVIMLSWLAIASAVFLALVFRFFPLSLSDPERKAETDDQVRP